MSGVVSQQGWSDPAQAIVVVGQGQTWLIAPARATVTGPATRGQVIGVVTSYRADRDTGHAHLQVYAGELKTPLRRASTQWHVPSYAPGVGPAGPWETPPPEHVINPLALLQSCASGVSSVECDPLMAPPSGYVCEDGGDGWRLTPGTSIGDDGDGDVETAQAQGAGARWGWRPVLVGAFVGVAACVAVAWGAAR